MSARFVTGRGALHVSTMPGTGNDGPQRSPAAADGHTDLTGDAVVDISLDGLSNSFSSEGTELDEVDNASGMKLDTELRTDADTAEAEYADSRCADVTDAEANLAEADKTETESAEAAEACARFASIKETEYDAAEEVAEGPLDEDAEEPGIAEADNVDTEVESRLDAGADAVEPASAAK